MNKKTKSHQMKAWFEKVFKWNN